MFGVAITRKGLVLCLLWPVVSMLPCPCRLAHSHPAEDTRVTASESDSAVPCQEHCAFCTAGRKVFRLHRVRHDSSQYTTPALASRVTGRVGQEAIPYSLLAPDPDGALSPDIFAMQILRQ